MAYSLICPIGFGTKSFWRDLTTTPSTYTARKRGAQRGMGLPASHNERRRPLKYRPLPQCLRGQCPGHGSSARPCGPSGSPCPSPAHTLSGPRWHSQHCVPAETRQAAICPCWPQQATPLGVTRWGLGWSWKQKDLTPGKGHTQQLGHTQQPSSTSVPPTCHMPTIALATRISMMTKGSTKAVMVSSPSSNQARTCQDRSSKFGLCCGLRSAHRFLQTLGLPSASLLWERYPWGSLGLERVVLRRSWPRTLSP